MTIKERIAKVLGKKIIECSRCHCKRAVDKNYRYSNCPKCLEQKRKARKKLKHERHLAREKEIEEQLRLGNLNYGLDPTLPYYLKNFSNFQKEYPEATFEDFREAKRLWRQQNTSVPKEVVRKPKKKLDHRTRRNRRMAREVLDDGEDKSLSVNLWKEDED